MTSTLRGYPVAVGDTVIMHDVNHRKGTPHPEYSVTKIARTRLTYVGPFGREYTARMEDGRIDDWAHLITVAESVEQEARAELWARIRVHGLEPVLGYNARQFISTGTLAAIASLLEGTS